VRFLHPGSFAGNSPPCGHSNSLKIFPSHPVTFLQTGHPRKSFSRNTYGPPRKCCKQKTYTIAKSFSCNTYKKQGGGGTLLLTRNLKKDFYSEVSAAADNGGPASSLPKKSRSSLRLSTFRPSDVRTFKRPPKTAGCVPTLPNLKLAPPPTSPQISFPPSHPLESPHCTNERACTHRNEARA